jgi:hypothetical protein
VLSDLPGVRQIRQRRRSGPTRGTGVGIVDEAIDAAELRRRLAEMGPAGRQAKALDKAVTSSLGGMAALSSLTTSLAVAYLERVQTPISAMTLASGVFITTRSYVAHRTVEGDPAAYGAVDVPVLGTLPELRKGRPPQDLLNRVVKATRRNFELVRALDAGLVVDAPSGVEDETVPHVGVEAATIADEEELDHVEPSYLDLSVVDGLTRFGWILRQVDIHYGLEPDES